MFPAHLSAALNICAGSNCPERVVLQPTPLCITRIITVSTVNPKKNISANLAPTSEPYNTDTLWGGEILSIGQYIFPPLIFLHKNGGD